MLGAGEEAIPAQFAKSVRLRCADKKVPVGRKEAALLGAKIDLFGVLQEGGADVETKARLTERLLSVPDLGPTYSAQFALAAAAAPGDDVAVPAVPSVSHGFCFSGDP